jgi:hypothetical protein
MPEKQWVLLDSSRVSATYFRSLIPSYATFVVPFLPVFSEADFISAIAEVGVDRSPSTLVLVLAAMTLNMSCPGPGEKKLDRSLKLPLCYRALHQRGPLMPDHRITVRSVVVPLFAATCLFADNTHSDMAFYYLREAITGIQILRVDDDSKMALLKSGDRAQCERLYWVLFIHERSHSIHSYRRPTLSALPHLVQHDPAIPAGVVNGFNQIIRLFRIIDDTFMTNWLDKRSATLTPTWIEEKQVQLGDEAWEDEIRLLTEMQQIDLIVTRDWLRTLVWQMALSKFLLTMDGSPDHQFMSILFPARISRRLRLALADFPLQAIEVHGTGILHKVFDITSTFADILEHILRTNTFDDQTVANYVNDFSFLFRFLDGMSKLYHIERTVLELRCETIRGLYPSFQW